MLCGLASDQGDVGINVSQERPRAEKVEPLSALHVDAAEAPMLWTIFVILLVLWLLGFLTGNTFGGLVHILIVVAVIVLVIQLLQGRRAH